MDTRNLRYLLSQIPLVKLALFFISGVISGIYLPFKESMQWAALLLILLSIFVIFLRNKFSTKNLLKKSRFASIGLISIVLVLGNLVANSHKQIENKQHFSNYLEEFSFVKVKISKPINVKEKSIQIKGNVLQVIHKDIEVNTKGKLMLYLANDSLSKILKYGDVVIIQTKINEISPPMNPHEFNYKQYMSFQNIFHQAYASSRNWQLIESETGNFVLTRIFHLRSHLKKVIDKYLVGAEEKAVANAILIGNKELLDDKLTQSYATSGAMHVLAVSGLHVGIIYLVFSFSLSLLKKTRFKTLLPFLLILSIWFYALITGASPSVLRAATMFSFITLGSVFKRHLNIYNTIAASAVVLILINPFIITEVGFQLSYLAVIGIIFLQPKIYKLFIISNWLLDKVWAITAVSIAAQIATFPLGVLYFHQFPNLFWVSNLIVIPAATFIVYLGVAMFVFSPIEFVANIIGKVLNGIIYILNFFVGKIDKIPYSLSSGLDITTFETWLIYLIILCLSSAIIFKMKNMLMSGLLIIFILSISISYGHLKNLTQSKFIVYYTPNASAIEFVKGKKAYSIIDKHLQSNESQLLFRIKHNWWNMKIKSFNNDYFLLKNDIEGGKLIGFKNHSFLLVDSNFVLPKDSFYADFVVVRHNPKLYLNTSSKKINTNLYIFDTSNPNWKLKYWRADCDSLKLPCYFVSDEGAYIANL